MSNGVDVGVLEAGAAHLGNLVVGRGAELADSLQRSAQQQRLLLDLDASLVSGRAIRESARDRLIATFVEMVARMYDDVGLTTDAATRTARIDRLESWSRDPEVEQRYREWSTALTADLSDWREGTAERVERRLNAASFRGAFPAIEDAVGVDHLRPLAPPTRRRSEGRRSTAPRRPGPVARDGHERRPSGWPEVPTVGRHQAHQQNQRRRRGAGGRARRLGSLRHVEERPQGGQERGRRTEVRSRVLGGSQGRGGLLRQRRTRLRRVDDRRGSQRRRDRQNDVAGRLAHREGDESQLRARVEHYQTQIRKALEAR